MDCATDDRGGGVFRFMNPPLLYPEPLENWNLDSAKAPAVASIAKRGALIQFGPLCGRSNPGALALSQFQFANRSGYISEGFRFCGRTLRGVKANAEKRFPRRFPHFQL